MAKKTFPEATKRLFTRVFVCKVCKSKIRGNPRKISQGKIKCRKCGARDFRPKRKPGARETSAGA